MPENTVFARKIIEFYSDRDIECSVVDEHLSLLVTLSDAGETHEFRYGNRAFAGATNWRRFYQVLERELSNLKAEVPFPSVGKCRFKARRRREAFAAL